MAPFLTCDPYIPTETQPSEFEIYMDGAAVPAITPAIVITGGKAFEYDLVSISKGSHTVIVKAALTDPIWGRQVSDASSPFVFVRPSAPRAPLNVRLST